MKSTTPSSTSSTVSSLVSFFKKGKKSGSSSTPPSSTITESPPSPSLSSSSSTLDLQLEFDSTLSYSTYTPAVPPPYYAHSAHSSSFGAEEDLEVIEQAIAEKFAQAPLSKEEIKRQRKVQKLLEEDRRMSEALKGMGL